jgi:hypothetical protein
MFYGLFPLSNIAFSRPARGSFFFAVILCKKNTMFYWAVIFLLPDRRFKAHFSVKLKEHSRYLVTCCFNLILLISKWRDGINIFFNFLQNNKGMFFNRFQH